MKAHKIEALSDVKLFANKEIQTEPTTSENPTKRQNRVKIEGEAKAILKDLYNKDPYYITRKCDKKHKEKVASITGLSVGQCIQWFCNNRNKERINTGFLVTDSKKTKNDNLNLRLITFDLEQKNLDK
jgi:hypothetical protein